jgi:hypothetical protein
MCLLLLPSEKGARTTGTFFLNAEMLVDQCEYCINDKNYRLYMLMLFVLGTLTIVKGEQYSNCSGLFRVSLSPPEP